MDRQMCDQLVDYFNGLLSKDEQNAFEKHLEACEECQLELTEWQLLTDDLPYIADSVNPPEGMKERVLNSVFDEELKLEEPSNASLPINEIDRPLKKKSISGWFPVVAAALVLSIGGNIFLASMVKTQQEDLTAQSEAVDQLLAFVNLTSVEGNSTGTASIVKHGDETRVVVQATSLPKLANDEVYQVWLIDEEGPKRAGTFKSDSTKGAVVFTLSEDMDKSWEQVAVSHEPSSDSQTPLGSVLMASKFE